jgi:hypothetical protein
MTSDVSLDEDFDFEKKYFTDISLNVSQEELQPWELLQKTFSERVKLIDERSNENYYLVDQVVLVKGLNDATRSLAVKYWEEEKNRLLFWDRFLLTATIGSLLLTGVSTFFVAPVACAVTGCSSLINFVLYYRMQGKIEKAQQNIQQWGNHPATLVADARARAYKNGFFYAMDLNLKGSLNTVSSQNILHPKEVSWLYEQDFLKKMQEIAVKMERAKFSDSDKAKWVEEFVKKNLLSIEAVSYAYDPQSQKRMLLEPWALSFSAYKEDVFCVQKEFEEKSTQITDQAQIEIDRFERQRELALNTPFSIKKARDDEAYKKYEGDQLKEALKSNKAIYKSTIGPINLYYDEQIASVKTWKTNSKQALELEKDKALSYYFQSAMNLFSGAFHSLQDYVKDSEPLYKTRHIPFYEEAPTPSAPPLESLI